MRLHYLQHVHFEDAGAIAEWAAVRGHELARTHSVTEEFPELDEFDMLVAMGGPMGVGDETANPWMAAEKRLIAEAIGAGKLVLGVCLGAQLVADALGADVRPGEQREIGWFPVDLTPGGAESPVFGVLPERFVAFHWHGDTFEVPEGAAHVASTKAFAHQGFELDGGRVVGMQFHLEMTAEGVRRLIDNCGGDIDGSRWVQPAAGLAAGEEHWGASARHLLFDVLDRMTAGAG